ncbi:MAG: class I SAM-dependent methyltransferase [Patescibacteria group bacterium]|jgi:SAM-dependent methyltransferase
MDEAFRKTTDFYNKQAEAFEAKTKDLQKHAWVDRFTSLVPEHGQILDIGCAYGRDSRSFADAGMRVEGIDGSEAMVEKAQKLVPEGKFFTGDIRSVPLEEQKYDGMWASGLFVHIPKQDISALLEKLNGALAEKGKLYGSIYLGTEEGLVKDERFEGAEKYYTYFTEEEFRSLLVEAGFEIVDFSPRIASEYERADVLEFIVEKANSSHL